MAYQGDVVTFSMDVSIDDKRKLYKAARAQAFEQFQTQPFDARATMRNVFDALRGSDGAIDVCNCVQWMLDPGVVDFGVSIVESRVDE